MHMLVGRSVLSVITDSAYSWLLIVRLCHHSVVASMLIDLQSNLRGEAVAQNVPRPKDCSRPLLGCEINSMCH